MTRAADPRRATLVAAAALAGAGGLGVEVLLLESAGLAFGAGRGAPLGLALYVAGWALGAWLAGRARIARLRAFFVLLGLAAAAQGALAFFALLGGGAGERPLAWLAAGAACIALVGLVQGTLLPLLVRAREARAGARGGIQAFWFAGLAGAVGGAFLFADALAGACGRVPAVVAAGGSSLAACLLAAGVTPARLATPPREAPGGGDPGNLSGVRAGLLVGAATAWMLALETVTLRLCLLWLGGMQNALAAHLAASLIALCAGALVLPRLLPRGRAGLAVLFAVAAAGSAWPLLAAPALRAVLAGGASSDARALLVALTLVGPALFAFGAVVPAVFRATTSGRPGEAARLGDLLLHEAWGALLGGPLVTFALVPWLGAAGALGAAALFAGGALLVALGRTALAPAGVAAAVAVVAFTCPPPARSSPKLANPALAFRAFEEDAGFAVSVVDDGVLGERTLLTDGFRAAGDGRDYRYMRVLGHLPVLLHPAPAKVCVVALGTGTTLGAVSLHPEVEAIEVLELSAAVVRQAHEFERVNRGALRDPRVTVTLGDGRHTLARRAGAYDVVTLEPLLADSPFAVYLYTEEFYAAAYRTLRPGGLVCQWVPPHALAPEVFAVVVDAFVRSFPASSVWLFDTQIALIGGDDAAGRPARFPAGGELFAALAELGIGSPAALLAHRVGAGAAWPRAPRRLTDADPWILYLDRRRGPDVIADLARNLRTLGSIEMEPAEPEGPAEPDAIAAARARWRGLRALARARAAHALDEAEQRGARIDLVLRPELERELAAAEQALAPDDPALVHFTSELAFLTRLRTGVALLARGDARSAVEPLTAAAELRPERGDARLYLAAALQAAGLDAAAREMFESARARCPRILATPAGLRVLALGFRPPA
jgi:spermidine synthase